MNDAWKAKQLMRKYNDCDVDDEYMRAKILKTMLHPECSEKIYIEPPMIIDYGYNIKAGDNLFVNFNSILLDTAPITLGCNVFIAPRVSIFTATHPICPKQRLEYDLAKPITM
jgi:maltose O-acetyltransferase